MRWDSARSRRWSTIFHDYGGHSPNPIVFLAAIASRTKRVRPITGAVIPAFNHPIKLAGELAMLDNICNGRLDVGFGRAFIPEEYAAYGLDMQESRARFDEGVAVIKRLWTEERDARGPVLAVQGRAFHAEAVSETASTDLGRGDRGGGSFVNAAKNGYHVMIVPYAGGLERTSALVKMYRQVWRESGTLPAPSRCRCRSTPMSPRVAKRPCRASSRPCVHISTCSRRPSAAGKA